VAIWQYDFIVAPSDEIAAAVGSLPAALTLPQMEALRSWSTRQPFEGFADFFSAWRPEMKSWHRELRMWGSEESNRIDVSYSGGHVNHVEFRVEIRSISVHFVELLAEFARRCNAVLVSAHSLAVIDPTRQQILRYLVRSGANEVWDSFFGAQAAGSRAGLPRVFLSHSSADKAFVSRLANDLQARKVPVWFDRWELKIGDSLTQRIQDGIAESSWLAIVLSKNSVKSEWVKKELAAAHAMELHKRSVFILPLVIDDCEIPVFLLDKLYADFRISYEHGFESLVRRVVEGAEVY
jgi:hypothetical protein